MDPSRRQWQAFLALSLLAFYVAAWAGEAPKEESKAEIKGEAAKAEPPKAEAKEEPKAEPKEGLKAEPKEEPKAPPKEEPKTQPKAPAKEEPKAEQPKIEPMPIGPEGQQPVAKVNGIVITRAELIQQRRQVALSQQGSMPSMDQILDQLIEEQLWQKQCEKERIRPTVDEIRAETGRFDAQLRQRGTNLDQFLQSRGLSPEEWSTVIGREIAKRRLVENIRQKVTSDEIEAEYKAHPEYYDGSRVRLSQILLKTQSAGTDEKKRAELKEKIERIYADLQAGKEFETLARNYSEGRTADTGGDIAWVPRKGDDERLMVAVWPLKVGEYSRPIDNALGWHILKVTGREPAYLTFQGCKEGITQALVRERLTALLAGLKKSARIEKLL